ncbi:MAG: enoyl-CoA hydratase/isomerase family protein [Actinomycetota bacterium]|jgi:enoyl-CoA hydratase/carnithine racemase
MEPAEIIRNGSTVQVKLARAEVLNAISSGLVASLMRAVEQAGAPGVRAMIITGTGRAFCAGADIEEVTSLGDGWEFHAWVRQIQTMVEAIADCAVPTIAAINGACMGGGLELAMACDFRLAARGANFALPEIHIGVLPAAGGLARLHQLVGPSTARRLVMLGEQFDADHAARIGLVDEVIPGDSLLTRADDLAKGFAERPAEALARAKAAFREFEEPSLVRGLRTEAAAAQVLFDTEERRSRMGAFLARRSAPRPMSS